MEPAYRYHRRVLKLLQWRCPPERWWLKTPSHMLSMTALDAVYPDARFVMTHRDVAKVLPSVCALYDTFTRVLTEEPDPVGHRHRTTWCCGARALERLVEFRDRGNEDRFFDLSFEAVQRDPMGQMEDLYAELGDELSDEARRRMDDWWTRELARTDRVRTATTPPTSASTSTTSARSSPSTTTASTSPSRPPGAPRRERGSPERILDEA